MSRGPFDAPIKFKRVEWLAVFWDVCSGDYLSVYRVIGAFEKFVLRAFKARVKRGLSAKSAVSDRFGEYAVLKYTSTFLVMCLLLHFDGP